MRITKKSWILLFVLCFSQGAWTQSQNAPVLHQRSEDEQSLPSGAAKGHSTLPDDVSGEYELDESGSVVQITIDHGRLTGYVTEMDLGTALTLFFDAAAVEGTRLSFTTRTVHGLRYSFAGTVMRGEAAAESESGYYVLAGDWTTYRNSGRKTERVSLKSTPRPQ
jgi:hypothetical protein